jgi:CheY-like chemotaxis protein
MWTVSLYTGEILKTIKILAATIPKLFPVIQQVYTAPEFCCEAYTTLSAAEAALNKNFDLIVCGVHFNDGQFYDFLRLAKAHPHTRHIPFVVVLADKESKSHYISQSVETASKALGADKVIPLSQWRDELGDEAAFEKFRYTIRKLLFDANLH